MGEIACLRARTTLSSQGKETGTAFTYLRDLQCWWRTAGAMRERRRFY